MLVGAFLTLNVVRTHGGLRLALVAMAVGWLLNTAAIIANGHMASPAGVLAGPRSPVNTWIGPHLAEHSVLGSHTRLPWLADAMVVHVPGYLISISLGDLVLATGVVLFVVEAMRTGGRVTKEQVASRWSAHP